MIQLLADVGAQKPVSKSAKKNAARKAKKSAETSNTSEEQRPAASTGGAKKSPVQSQQTASQPTQEGAHCQGASDDANEKRARALKKKIRQISELQDKQAGGAELTPEQKTKLDSLADLCVPNLSLKCLVHLLCDCLLFRNALRCINA